MTLGLPQLQQALSRVSYKPGWSFRLWETRWEGIAMGISFTAPNAYDKHPAGWVVPADPVVINVKTFVPPCKTGVEFYAWLAYRLSRIELHEMREFLKVDGVCLDDPHAEGANDEFLPWDGSTE